jgi:hypothetical protein
LRAAGQLVEELPGLTSSLRLELHRVHRPDAAVRADLAEGDLSLFEEPYEVGARHAEEACRLSVQAWLDLLGHPERASEAAQDLREHHLPWSRP